MLRRIWGLSHYLSTKYLGTWVPKYVGCSQSSFLWRLPVSLNTKHNDNELDNEGPGPRVYNGSTQWNCVCGLSNLTKRRHSFKDTTDCSRPLCAGFFALDINVPSVKLQLSRTVSASELKCLSHLGPHTTNDLPNSLVNIAKLSTANMCVTYSYSATCPQCNLVTIADKENTVECQVTQLNTLNDGNPFDCADHRTERIQGAMMCGSPECEARALEALQATCAERMQEGDCSGETD